MNLKRQLLLVSLLTLMLPWAGCEFIRETESALREGQQQMLAGTARALAATLAQYREEFPRPEDDYAAGDRLYIHELASRPRIDGYFDDWPLSPSAQRILRGSDGPVRVVLGAHADTLFLYVEVSDREVVFAPPGALLPERTSANADRVSFVTNNPPYLAETVTFAAEAPGPILSYRQNAYGVAPEPAVEAWWQDIPGGYRVEARIPATLAGTHLGVVVHNTASPADPGVRSASFAGRGPGPAMRELDSVVDISASLVQPGMRLIVTDRDGWRIATVGQLTANGGRHAGGGLARRIYDLLVESGTEADLAEPDPQGREHQPYVSAALQGREMASWFRSAASGRAIVAVAAPIGAANAPLGSLVLQQGTDAILSLTNSGLSRLINVTVIATLVVGAALLGYATWLSRRIRALSVAAERALEEEDLSSPLPSELAGDEVGDLSRSFSYVLRQLGDYNEYLRTLASKLSHELHTPLAIVTSSLENLEHEPLNEAAQGYTGRAREGTERLRAILNAMSEASRVEELMKHAEPEPFELGKVVESMTSAYSDVYPERVFDFACPLADTSMQGSPELVIQLLDKLVDNAVSFSGSGDHIAIDLAGDERHLQVGVTNPGPPLPGRMRGQLFDSMVSLRGGSGSRHLGLGLYVARLIAEGHGGRIEADNVEGGVQFTVTLARGSKAGGPIAG